MERVVGVLAAGFMAALAAGCVSSGSSKPTAPAGPPVVTADGFSMPPGSTLIKSTDGRELQKRRETGYSDQEIQSLVRNKTVLFFDPQHQNQIEYYGADGTAHLWYRDNKISVPSKWYVEANKTICFIYSSSSYNPATKTYGGKPECRPIADWDMNAVDRAEGDIFGLSSGKVPKVMSGFQIFVKLNDVRQGLGLKTPAAAATPPSAPPPPR